MSEETMPPASTGPDFMPSAAGSPAVMTNNAVMPEDWNIPQSTLNDANKLYVQGMNFVPDGSQAILYLFSPQYMPEQVVHTYQYQLNEDFLNNVLSPGGTMEQNVANGKDKSIKQAIMPAAGGLVVDTQNFNSMWSFVLIIDAIAPTRTIRQLAIGYVYDQPISDTGAINQNATLVFTRTAIKHIRGSVGYNAPGDRMCVFSTSNLDYTNRAASVFYNDQAFVGAPKDLMLHKLTEQDSGYAPADYSDLSLNAMGTAQRDTKILNVDNNSPMAMLSEITGAIDKCGQGVNRNDTVISRLMQQGEDPGKTPVEQMITKAADQMPGAIGLQVTTGLDTSVPMTLGMLQMQYENLRVYPHRVRVGSAYGWDRLAQTQMGSNGVQVATMSPKLQMSFMVGAAIQSICNSLSIADMSFHYHVLAQDTMFGGNGRQEYFRFLEFQTFVPRSQDALTVISGYASNLLKSHIFEVIDTVSEEYMVNVVAHMNGDILVDLRLAEFPDPGDGTWYQTSARLGGIMNPAIGTVDIIASNGNSLYNATEALAGAQMPVAQPSAGGMDMLPAESNVMF